MVYRANMLAMAPDDLLDQICEDERAALLQQLRQQAGPDDLHLIANVPAAKLRVADE